jgi:hypothetical protein
MELGVYGIVIVDGTITSDLKVGDIPGHEEFDAAMDGIESIILAHHEAGIDVSSPAYLEGIETAVQACANNL